MAAKTTDYSIGVFRHEGIEQVLNAVNTYISGPPPVGALPQPPPPPRAPQAIQTPLGEISTTTLFTLSLFTKSTQKWTKTDPNTDSVLNTYMMITHNSITLQRELDGIMKFVEVMADILAAATGAAGGAPAADLANYVHELHIAVACPGGAVDVEAELTAIRTAINTTITEVADAAGIPPAPLLLYNSTGALEAAAGVPLFGGKSQSSKRKNRKRMMRKSQKNKK